MHEGVLHIRDVQGPKKTGTVEARLEVVEQEIFRCQGMVERGLSVNHSMITEFTHDQKVDGRSLKDVVFTLNEQINFLQGQILDLRNQIFEYEARFKVILGGDFNLIRFDSDKSSGNVNNTNALFFNDWINKWGLMEINIANRKCA
ncbi:40S ribosomal protein S5-1 [Hordeum vulgare]|nr:40S ribosomal protein S5-1 [Hordeum vulgare]